MRDRITALFRNAGFILALAFVFGLALPQAAPQTSPALVPLLAIALTLSITGVSLRTFLDFRSVSRQVMQSLLLSYVILAFTFIGLAFLIVKDPEIRLGFVILASVPPAVAVIPFSYRLGGNVPLALVGTLAAYIASLGLIPLFSIGFLGLSLASPGKLLISLLEMIVVPLGVAQLLRLKGLDSKIEKYRGTIINWSFFVAIYTIVGLNRGAFLAEPQTLLIVCGIGLVSSFVLAYLINRVTRFFKWDKPSRISFVLLGTWKNNALAAVIALELFGPRAAIPAAVTTAFAIALFVWLSFRKSHQPK